MKSGFPTLDTIREYLLGRLDDQPDLESRMSQQVIFDDELSEIVDSIEEEIIDEYLEGRLNAADKEAVEEDFLRPPQRRKKLQLARLLHQHLEKAQTKPDNLQNPALESLSRGIGNPLTLHWHSYFRTYFELGLVLLLLITTSSLVYLANLRHGLQSQLEASHKVQMQLEDKLAQEREHSANLTMRLGAFTVTTLSFPAVFRSTADSTELPIAPSIQQIHIEIDVRGVRATDFDVDLKKQAREQVWWQKGLKPSTSGILQFELPRQILTAGSYCFEVSPQPGGHTSEYCFRPNFTK